MHCFVILLLLLFPFSVQAEEIIQWKVMSEKSHIKFTFSQMGPQITGEFKNFDAQISFIPERLAENSMNVTIDIDSIYTDDKTRDATLKNSDWFDIDNFSTAKFSCKEFKFVGGFPNSGTYMCYGNLTILNITKPIELPFHLDIKDNIANMTASITINRLDFMLGKGDWLDTSVIKENVKIDIKITAKE